jgi:hypothetical protein
MVLNGGLEGAGSGTDDADIPTERRWDDGADGGETREGVAVGLGTHRDKERVARGGDASADHDNIGIKSIDHGAEATAEVVDGLVPNLNGERVFLCQGLEEVMRGDLLDTAGETRDA